MTDKEAGKLKELIEEIGRRLFFSIAWGCLGLVSGASLAVVVVMAHAPDVDPNEPLAHEGYGMAAHLLVLFQGVAGLVLGAVIGLSIRNAWGRRTAFGCPLLGALLATGATWILRKAVMDPAHESLGLGLIGQAIGGFLGFASAVAILEPHRLVAAIPRVEDSAGGGLGAGEPDS